MHSLRVASARVRISRETVYWSVAEAYVKKKKGGKGWIFVCMYIGLRSLRDRILKFLLVPNIAPAVAVKISIQVGSVPMISARRTMMAQIAMRYDRY